MTDSATQDMYLEMSHDGFRILEEWKHTGQVNYGDAFLELGAKGQFSDIWRKIKKLKRAVWEGKPLIGEQAETIAAELIPHCLMLIYCLQHQEPKLSPRSPKTIGVAQEDIKAGDALDIDFTNGLVRRVPGLQVPIGTGEIINFERDKHYAPIECLELDEDMQASDRELVKKLFQQGMIKVVVRS